MSRIMFKDGDKNIIVEDPAVDTIKLAIKEIPTCSIFVTQGKEPISKLIGFWGLINYLGDTIKYILKNKTDKVLWSHAGLYMGGGDNLVIEAIGKGISQNSFMEYFNGKTDHVEVWSFPLMTVDQVQKIKDFAYSQVGRKYDIKAFANFILQKIGHDEGKYICTELTIDAYRAGGVPIVAGNSWNIHPVQLIKFLSDEGIALGFTKILEYDC